MMSLLFSPQWVEGEAVVNFNQNSTSLLVASQSGFSVYSLEAVDKLKKFHRCSTKGVVLLDRLHQSSLVLFVGENRRVLKVCDIMKRIEICNYTYPSSILAIKINTQRMVVCLEHAIYIHDLNTMKILHSILDTPSNSAGLCALSDSLEHCYLAYPGSTTSGEILLYDAFNLRSKFMIAADDIPLAAMAFSPSGTQLATTNEHGCIILIFSTVNGDKLAELRRGFKRCVTVNCLVFSTCSRFLVLSSNSETVHVFRLDYVAPESTDAGEESEEWLGYSYLRYLGETVSSYLLNPVSDVFTQNRSFAKAVLPKPGIRRVCAFITIKNELRLLVASEDGYLYVFAVPTETGGRCKLIKRHDLLYEDYYVVDPRIRAESTGYVATASTSTMEVKESSLTSSGAPSLSEKEEPVLPSTSNYARSRLASTSNVTKSNCSLVDALGAAWLPEEEIQLPPLDNAESLTVSEVSATQSRNSTVASFECSFSLEEARNLPPSASEGESVAVSKVSATESRNSSTDDLFLLEEERNLSASISDVESMTSSKFSDTESRNSTISSFFFH